jgi:hypothetical protein
MSDDKRMNISDEAVEAAARAYTHAAPYLSAENAIREALEAAAPHLMAEAWEQGWDAEGWQANPYRSAGAGE